MNHDNSERMFLELGLFRYEVNETNSFCHTVVKRTLDAHIVEAGRTRVLENVGQMLEHLRDRRVMISGLSDQDQRVLAMLLTALYFGRFRRIVPPMTQRTVEEYLESDDVRELSREDGRIVVTVHDICKSDGAACPTALDAKVCVR